MLRPSRSHVPSTQTLDLRIALFVAGALFGVVGMVRGSRTLITIGIAILAVGMLIGIIEGRRLRHAAEDAEDSSALQHPAHTSEHQKNSPPRI